MLPSFQEIHYFIEVAKQGNITRASEKLGLSQPSLTQAIKRLEESIQETLLIRSKKGVTLTPAGKKLYQYGHKIIEDWHGLKRQAIESHSLIKGRYRLGAHPSVALYSFSNFIPSLLKENPQIELSLKHDLSRNICQEIIDLNIDIGIVVNPIPHSDLVIKPLAKDEVCFWKSKNLTSENRKVLICHPDLIQTQKLVTSKTLKLYDRIIHTDNLEVITDLTAHGAGIGIIPTRVIKKSKHRLQKVSESSKYIDKICMVYRHEMREIAAIKELKEKIGKAF